MNTPQNQQGDDSKVATGCIVVLAIFGAMAFYGWYSGGWERGYERERIQRQRRDQEILECLQRAYEMSPEEYQRALNDANRDAPVGQTRGGDWW